MTAPSVLLLGGGGHARACIDVIEQERRFVIAGFVGLAEEVGTRVFGFEVLGADADLPALLARCPHALVTVGQIKTPDARIRLFDAAQRHGADLPVIVSPRAYVSPHATLGAGTVVLHGAIVNAGAAVGRNCIINSQSLIEHDAVIGDHCHISTAATINGGVTIGAGTFVGSGATVRQSLNIGERSVIGMGHVVFAGCEPGSRLPPSRARS